MRRAGRFLVFLLLLGGAAVFVWEEMKAPTGEQAGAAQGQRGQGAGGRRAGGRRGGGQEGPTSVLTAPVQRQDVPVKLEAVGTAQALNTVTVRSQVDGRILELPFREGQDVKRGEVIARIDPAIYQAQFDQAVAKKAQDEANLANARLDLVRYQNLATANFGSKQQADTQRATVAQLEAQIKSDQGAIDSARTYLDYTTVRTPLDGRLGIRLVDAGNIVHASDATGLVVITQLRPVTVLFNLPQQNLRAVNRAFAAGDVPVEALESDNKTVLDRGRLEVVDNQVDQSTGTVKIKATFPNADLQLWPGSFVNVRVTVDTLRGVVVVPSQAVQRGPNGTFVYGVEDGKAVLKPVTLALQTEEISVVSTGLAPPAQVITTGFTRLTDGDPVAVSVPTARTEPAGPPPPPGRRGRDARDAPGDAPGTGERPRSRERSPDGTGTTGDVRPDGDRPRRRREGQGGEMRGGEARPPATPQSGEAPPPGTTPGPGGTPPPGGAPASGRPSP